MITQDSEPTQMMKSLLDLHVLYQEQINEILNLSDEWNTTDVSAQHIGFNDYLQNLYDNWVI